MFRTSLTAALALLLLLVFRQPGAASEIPFTFRDGLIWVRIAAPGAPSGLNFLLDSGASASALDLQTARRLGLNPGRSLTVQGVHTRSVAYELNAFEGALGPVPVPRKVLAVDLGGVSRGCHQRIDGLLGADFFAGRIVQIDYARRCLRIHSRGAFAQSLDGASPLSVRNGAMCIRAAVAHHPPGWMRVDTGCDSALECVAGARVERPIAATSIATTTGGARQFSTDVQIGRERLTGVKSGLHSRPIFSGESGLIGNGILSQFTVTFDRDGKRLLLTKR